MNNTNLIVGCFATILGILVLIFPTKDKCSKCRDDLYKEINTLKKEKADKSEIDKLYGCVHTLTTQIQSLNNNVIKLTTIIEYKLGFKVEDRDK